MKVEWIYFDINHKTVTCTFYSHDQNTEAKSRLSLYPPGGSKGEEIGGTNENILITLKGSQYIIKEENIQI